MGAEASSDRLDANLNGEDANNHHADVKREREDASSDHVGVYLNEGDTNSDDVYENLKRQDEKVIISGKLTHGRTLLSFSQASTGAVSRRGVSIQSASEQNKRVVRRESVRGKQ